MREIDQARGRSEGTYYKTISNIVSFDLLEVWFVQTIKVGTEWLLSQNCLKIVNISQLKLANLRRLRRSSRLVSTSDSIYLC